MKRVGLAGATLLLTGCGETHPQSILHPVGPAAEAIAWLTWLMVGVYSVVFVAVMVLLAVALWRRRRGAGGGPGVRFVFIAGVVVPGLVLAVMLWFTIGTTLELRRPETGLTIRVVGNMWWWHVEYPEHGIVTANELHVPVGVPVRVELSATDVVHSFWVPNLAGKMDMLPGHPTVFWLQADQAGVYRGQCAEYCGLQHAWMAFDLVALPPAGFEAWVAERRAPPAPPQTPAERRGAEVYAEAGCGTCHAVRGSDPIGNIGPDLTHVGSRRTLAAGRIPNTDGALAGWIANPQAIKPGNAMPGTFLPPADLHALVAYLRSLR